MKGWMITVLFWCVIAALMAYLVITLESVPAREAVRIVLIPLALILLRGLWNLWKWRKSTR